MFKPLKVPCLQTLDELKAKCKRLGLRMILPDHLKPVKHKRNREETPEDLVKKTKRFKIEIEQLTKNHLQMLGMINKKDSQENDRPLNGLAEIGLIQQNGVLQLNSKLNDMTNGKLINGGIVIENAKIECNGVWHSNGRLRNVRLDFNKLCKGVPEDENQKQPDQIMIIEGLELDKVEREKSKNHSPEIIEIDLMSEDDEEKPSEILITPTPMPTIVEEPPPSTPANVKPVSRFYKKDDLGNMQRFVKNLNNYAELTKAFSHLIELKKYADELNAQIVKCKPVAVVNDVDLEMPPKFTYTNGYDLSMLDQSVRTKIAEDVQKCKFVISLSLSFSDLNLMNPFMNFVAFSFDQATVFTIAHFTFRRTWPHAATLLTRTAVSIPCPVRSRIKTSSPKEDRLWSARSFVLAVSSARTASSSRAPRFRWRSSRPTMAEAGD